MRRIGRVLAAALCLTAALALGVSGALAADEPALYIEGGAAQGSVYHVYFRVTADAVPTAETLRVLADGQELSVQSVQTYGYVGAGTSYFILADGRTSVIERALGDIRRIASAVAEGMAREDNIYIGQIGGTFDPDGFLTDGDRIAERIRAISPEDAGSDLNQSIAEALDCLTESPLVKGRKCLVVIADGLDDSADGLSTPELTEKIRAAQIPICTVALTYGTDNSTRVDAAKTLSGFARQSGGLPILLGEGGIDAGAAAGQVLGLREQAYAAVVNASELRAVAGDAEAAFSLTLKTSAGDVGAERSLDISALPAEEPVPDTPEPAEPEPTAEPEPEPTAAALPEEMAQPAEDEKAGTLPDWFLWAAIAAAAVIVAAVLLIVLLGRKKRGKKGPATEVANGPVVRYDRRTVQTPGGFDGPELVVVRMGRQEGVRFQLRMTQPLVVGRDPQRAQLVIDEDAQLAGAQCRLDWQGGRLVVSDLAGGTLLDGAPVGTGAVVPSGGVLHMGACDYRIFWEKA